LVVTNPCFTTFLHYSVYKYILGIKCIWPALSYALIWQFYINDLDSLIVVNDITKLTEQNWVIECGYSFHSEIHTDEEKFNYQKFKGTVSWDDGWDKAIEWKIRPKLMVVNPFSA
jgi:hypothetical protein